MAGDNIKFATPGGLFCRRCGYDLRVSADRCPECGRPFDATNPRTYRTKPPSAVICWAKRILIPIAILAIAYGAFVGWLWWGWRDEQKAIRILAPDSVVALRTTTARAPFLGLIPTRWRFITQRANFTPDDRSGNQIVIDSDEKLAQIGHLRYLKELRILKGAFTPGGMANLRGLTRLEDLAIWEVPVDDAAVANMSGMRSMRILRLRHASGVTDAGLIHIANMPQLSMLFLDQSRISDTGLSQLAPLTKLSSVSLSQTQITGIGLRNLSFTNTLRELTVFESNFSDHGLAALKGATVLNSLVLQKTDISDTGLANIASATEMTRLDLRNTRVTDEGMAHLAGMTKLTNLSLDETQVAGPGLKHLSRMRQLFALRLSRTAVRGPGLEHLAMLPRLYSVYLADTFIDDAGLAYLQNYLYVGSLNLSGTQITDDGLHYLSGLKTLATLNLSGTKITGSRIGDLAPLSNLTTLDLSNTQMSDDAADQLTVLIAGLSQQRHHTINLAGTRISTTLAKRLLESHPYVDIKTDMGLVERK